MGTKKAPATTPEATDSIFDQLIKGSKGPGRSSRPQLKPNHPFLYFVSPSEVEIMNGDVCLQPQRVRLEPGVYVDNQGNFDNCLRYQAGLGRQLVDGNIEVIAFGEKVKGYIKRVEVGRNSDGVPFYHYHDVWTRYSRVGSVTVKEFDRDGFHKFRQQCLGVLDLTEVHPSIAKPLLAQMKRALNRAKQTASHYASQTIAVEELSEILGENKEG